MHGVRAGARCKPTQGAASLGNRSPEAGADSHWRWQPCLLHWSMTPNRLRSVSVETQNTNKPVPHLEAVQTVVPEPAGLLSGCRVLDDAGEPGLGGHLRQQRDVVPRAQRLRLGILRARARACLSFVSLGGCDVSDYDVSFGARLSSNAGRLSMWQAGEGQPSRRVFGFHVCCILWLPLPVKAVLNGDARGARLPLADDGLGGTRVQLPLGAPLVLPGQAPAAAAPAMPALRGRRHLHRRHRLPAEVRFA